MARTQLSLASCNLYNLNQPGLGMYTNTQGWSQAEYDFKIDWLATQLNALNADVWGFQELWHTEALKEAFRRAKLLSKYKLLAPPSHQGQGIICAGAVRKDIVHGTHEWMTDFPQKFILQSGGDDDQAPDIGVSINKFSRPVLRFQIKPHSRAKAIEVFVAHFKSKRQTDIYREGWYRADNEYYKHHRTALGAAISTIRRTAEAAALRVTLTETLKNTDTPVAVLGDLNDGQHSNTLNIISEQPRYLQGLSEGGVDNGLYTVGTLQEYRSLRDVYYTHIYQNARESLDHILVSQEFYDNSQKRVWAFKGMELINDHLNRDDHKASGTSDHGIVFAKFEHRPA